jgi:hypothetical protein
MSIYIKYLISHENNVYFHFGLYCRYRAIYFYWACTYQIVIAAFFNDNFHSLGESFFEYH